MLPNWFYELSASGAVLLCSLLFVGIVMLGGLFLRPRLDPLLKGQPERNQSIGYSLSFFNLINGLLLSLLAVATYQNHANVYRIVIRESAALVALYRDVSSLSEPNRSELQTMVRDYTKYLIDEVWPLQRRGQVPPRGVYLMNDFQKRLAAVYPENRTQEIVLAAAFRQFNEYIEHRRLRIYSVKSDIPDILWFTVATGLALHFLMFLFLDLRLATYLIFGGLSAFFTGVVFSMILLMDHPFQGPLAISAEPLQIVYDGVMSLSRAP